MPALDDGQQLKIYPESGLAAGQKELIIGTKRTDSQMTSTDRIVSFCTNAASNVPVEKAYIDKDGQIFGVAGSGGAALNNDGTLNVNVTAVGNVGASGPDDLISYTLPASTLNATGRGVRITAWGTTANNANAKTVRLVFGGTTLITKQLTASVAGTWELSAIVIKTGSSTQTFWAKALNSGGTAVANADGPTIALLSAQNTASETDTATIVIKGQSTTTTNDNDIVQQGMLVEFV